MPTEHEHNKKQVKRETAAVTRVPCVLDFHAYSYETKCLCLFEFASWLASVGLTTDKYQDTFHFADVLCIQPNRNKYGWYFYHETIRRMDTVTFLFYCKHASISRLEQLRSKVYYLLKPI